MKLTKLLALTLVLCMIGASALAEITMDRAPFTG